MKTLVHPKHGPDSAYQPILGECPSTNFVHEIIPTQEESLLPSGD